MDNPPYALPLDLAWQRLVEATASKKVRWAGGQTEDGFFVMAIIVMGTSDIVITSDVEPTLPDAINAVVDRYKGSKHYVKC